MKKLWELDEALALVRSLQEELLPVGWAVGLTGSVLFKGYSDKDLDLIFYPRTTAKVDVPELFQVLERMGFKAWLTVEQIHKIWRQIGSADQKNVSSWKYGRRRVDVFILK